MIRAKHKIPLQTNAENQTANENESPLCEINLYITTQAIRV